MPEMKSVVSSSPLRKVFLKFLAVIALLSALGGYQLSQLIARVNASSAQRSAQLLEIEERMDDAAIGLGRQIQEWKDMLLRADNKELYGKHLTGFKDASIAVQYALLSAKRDMEAIGMDTSHISHLMSEHKAVLSEYLAAYSRFAPGATGSPSTVDMRIIGVDRKLQSDIATVRAGISEFARQQLTGTSAAEKRRHLMFGLLGAVCLLFMALFGFAFAYQLIQARRRSV